MTEKKKRQLVQILGDYSDEGDFSTGSADDYTPSDCSTDSTNSSENEDFTTRIQEYIEQSNIQKQNTIENNTDRNDITTHQTVNSE